MTIVASLAENIFRLEADCALRMEGQNHWIDKIEQLSELCEKGGSATHIAFLGTALLAKSVDHNTDLRAIKPTHAHGNPNAYSARTLCHLTLVPLAAELGVSLGVNGREPLNNQPYFRMTHLGDETPIHSKARPAFDYMIELIDELQNFTTKQARSALRAFIAVRRRYRVVYATSTDSTFISWTELSQAIRSLVQQNSEGGKRAQAAAAGIFDVIAGPSNVLSGRINDPSRHYPGDIAVIGDKGLFIKAIEVRDKPVAESDIYIFGQGCISRGVTEAAVLMASPRQLQLDDRSIMHWASTRSLGLTMFYGWDFFVDKALFWAVSSKPEGVSLAVDSIQARLVSVEASADAVVLWRTLTRLAT